LHVLSGQSLNNKLLESCVDQAFEYCKSELERFRSFSKGFLEDNFESAMSVDFLNYLLVVKEL